MNEDETNNSRKSTKRVRFLKIDSMPEEKSSSSLVQFLTRIRQNNVALNNHNIELKELDNRVNVSRYNSILKKSSKNQVDNEELVRLNNVNHDDSNIFYSFVPITTTTTTTTSSSSSLKSECDARIPNSVASNAQFDFIVEEFITRLMCKTKGNHNCTLCYKHKNKSLDDKLMNANKSIQQTNSCKNLNNCKSSNREMINKNFSTLPMANIKRNIEDRLSFRVTNLTIDDLKTKYHSKNTL